MRFDFRESNLGSRTDTTGENIPTDGKHTFWNEEQFKQPTSSSSVSSLNLQGLTIDWDEPELLSQHVPGPLSMFQNFSNSFTLRQTEVCHMTSCRGRGKNVRLK